MAVTNAEAETRPSLSKQLSRSRDGASAIEYALIAGFMLLAIAVAANELSRQIGWTHDRVAEGISVEVD